MSWRPWTAAAKRVAQLRGNKRKPLEPINKWNIVRGDLVEILAGKDKGKQGKVSVVARRQHQIIVSGLNTHIRVLPPSGEFPGGRVPSEAPLHISNVALVDPKDGKPCRVKHMYTEEGLKVRVSRRTGAIVPKPPEVNERRDFKSRSGYIEGPKDSSPDDVTNKTYVPVLLTFEEEMQLLTKTKATHKGEVARAAS